MNGVIIEDEFYLLDCTNSDFMFNGIYGEDDIVKKRLITMNEFYFSYQSDVVLCDDNATYRFKYTIPEQIEEEINTLFMKD